MCLFFDFHVPIPQVYNNFPLLATAIIAWIIFGQKLSPAGIAGLILIVAGCVILNLFGTPGQG